MTTIESQRETAQQIRLALLAAMQDVGKPDEVTACDYLSASNEVPTTPVNLTTVCGGKGEIDPYLKLRMAR